MEELFNCTTKISSYFVNRYIKNSVKTFDIALSILIVACSLLIFLGFIENMTFVYFSLFCLIFVIPVIFIRFKTTKQIKNTFHKYMFNNYEYHFYDVYFTVIITVKDGESKEAKVGYENINNLFRDNGILGIELKDKSILFLDEYKVSDKNKYNELLAKFM